MMIVLIFFFVTTAVVSGDLVPVYGFFETLQLIVHLPLVGVNLPGSITLFLQPLTDIVQFNFFGVNDAFRERWGVSKDDLAYNQVFY